MNKKQIITNNIRRIERIEHSEKKNPFTPQILPNEFRSDKILYDLWKKGKIKNINI